MTVISIWVDEAGRGAWAWPVVAWAFVILHSKFKRREVYSKINDSKQLTKIQRNWIFEELVFAQKQGEVAFHTAYIWPDSIDRLGIKEANRQAMELAIHEVLEKVFITTWTRTSKIEIHIDGNDHYEFDFGKQKQQSNISVTEHVRGDQKFKYIWAASILAKVTRDTLMESYFEKFPDYGFEKHKGYGTAEHREALARFGVLEIHRKSYSPIKYVN